MNSLDSHDNKQYYKKYILVTGDWSQSRTSASSHFRMFIRLSSKCCFVKSLCSVMMAYKLCWISPTIMILHQRYCDVVYKDLELTGLVTVSKGYNFTNLKRLTEGKCLRSRLYS